MRVVLVDRDRRYSHKSSRTDDVAMTRLSATRVLEETIPILELTSEKKNR